MSPAFSLARNEVAMQNSKVPFTAVWDHIHLRVTDPNAVAAWFEEMLGAEPVRAPDRIDVILGGQKIFLLDGGQILFTNIRV